VDYSQLSDPQLLAEAERVRSELEQGLPTMANRVELGKAYDDISEEYNRRCASHTAGQ
jgi:hypothetical protein